MSKIQTNSGRVAIAAAVVLAAGLALQIGAIYLRSVSASNLMTTIGKASTFVGGAGVGIALPIYILERGKSDPNIYKKLIIASLVAVIAGAVLMNVNTGHPASKMIGQSLLTLSGGLLVTMLFYYLIYGRDTESSAATIQPVNNPERRPQAATHAFTGATRALGTADGATQEERRQNADINRFKQLTHSNMRKTMFGAYQFPVIDRVAEAPTSLEEATKGLIAMNERHQYTLVSDGNACLLRLSSGFRKREGVKAEIFADGSWTDLGDWNHLDPRIQPFIQHLKGEEETAM